MVKVNIAEASRRLEELIARAYAGETIVIEREGGGEGEGVRLAPEGGAPAKPAPKFDAEKARERLAKLPMDARPQQAIIDEWKNWERD